MLSLFIALETQWRVSVGWSGIAYSGIDYAAAEVLMRARRIKDRDQVFGDLREMERAAIPILNKAGDGDE